MLVQSTRGALLSSSEPYMGITCKDGATFALQRDLVVGWPHGKWFQPAGCAACRWGWWHAMTTSYWSPAFTGF